MTPTDDPQSPRPGGPVHGQLSYLQIPAVDLTASATFYASVFGWQVDAPSFEAPGPIGQWVLDRPPAADAGLLAWIHVDDLDAALERAREAGGEVLEPPSADGPTRRLATIRDPAGNVLGVVWHEPA
jgi:uncharacterized protein